MSTDNSCMVTPIGNKKMSVFGNPMSSVKRKSSIAFSDSPFVIPPSPMMKRLGCGTQVTVYRYKRQKVSGDVNASPWAIKKGKLGLTRAPVINRLTAEGAILRQLNHPNIVKFKKLTKTEEGEVCLSMEAFGKGLDDLICKRQETGEIFNSKQIMKVAWTMANALNYLHNTIHLLHGDMKSGNVLVKGKFEEVKLCDFGVSIFLKDDLSGPKNPTDPYTGSEPWLSKEVLDTPRKITDKADIFAYGLVIWEMLALDVPHVHLAAATGESLDGSFTDTNASLDTMPDEYYEALGTRPPLPDLDYPSEYSPVIGTFVCCTCEDYTERPNAAAIVESLTEYNSSEDEKVVDKIPSENNDEKVEQSTSPEETNGHSNDEKVEQSTSPEETNGDNNDGEVEQSTAPEKTNGHEDI